jgi:pimeloyl-ACP methyl ester carboxylesterase
LELINERVKDKADIVAHSEGGINTSIAATLQTEKFRNIVFTNSGGLMGPDSFVGLNNRFNLNLVTEAIELLATKDPEKESRLRTHILSNLKYIAQNPIRATKEAVAISSTQIDGVLDYLHGEGVGIIVLCADSDKIFPTEKVKELLKDKKVDKMVIMPGGHNELGTDPDNYVDAITKAISEVNHIAQ